MLKFYLCAIFLVMLINSIYPLWAMFHTCKDIEPTIHPLASDDRCLHIGVLYYLDYDYEINLLKNYDPPIYNVRPHTRRTSSSSKPSPTTFFCLSTSVLSSTSSTWRNRRKKSNSNITTSSTTHSSSDHSLKPTTKSSKPASMCKPTSKSQT
jgi:hypothetical protein